MQAESPNKTILITGAGGDLGKEIVKKCMQNNWRIIALTSNKPKLNAFVQKMNYSYIHIYECDFTTVKNRGSFNFLPDYKYNYIVLNAGYLNKKPFLNQTSEDIFKHFTINFIANIYLLQYIITHQLLEKKAHILAIGSLSGKENVKKFSGMTLYGASKAALHNLIQTLASEYNKSTIAFNVLSLGVVETKMKQKAFPDVQGEPPSKIADFIINFLEKEKESKNGEIIQVSKSVE